MINTPPPLKFQFFSMKVSRDKDPVNSVCLALVKIDHPVCVSEPRRTKLTVSCCRRSKLTGQSILTDAEMDKMCRVLYLHNPSLKKLETLDLLYGQYNELTLWISARSETIICLVTNGLMIKKKICLYLRISLLTSLGFAHIIKLTCFGVILFVLLKAIKTSIPILNFYTLLLKKLVGLNLCIT